MEAKMYLTTFKVQRAVSNFELIDVIKEWPQLFGENLTASRKMTLIRDMRSFHGLTIETDHNWQNTERFRHDLVEVESVLNHQWQGYDWEIAERERTVKVKNRAHEIDQLLTKALNGDVASALEFCKIYSTGELTIAGPYAS